MKSTTGKHFVALDHLRALAAFMVVVWHFSHRADGRLVPAGQSPELGLLDEGHSGVALFMTLSGFLFARLIGDRRIDIGAFLFNRVLRLAPMFFLAMFLALIVRFSDEPGRFLQSVLVGFVDTTQMPQGGWSITTELHFYVLLPAILWGTARWPRFPIVILSAVLLGRVGLWAVGADIKALAYASLVGRIDQFMIGILFARRDPGRLAVPFMASLWLVYAAFSYAGGFYEASSSLWWVFLPTVEAVGFGSLICWYEKRPLQGAWTKPIQSAGEYSYSIYLLHFLVVGVAANRIDRYVMPIDSIYVALPWAALFFAFMVLVSRTTYRCIELPALRYRKPYLRSEDQPAVEPAFVAATR